MSLDPDRQEMQRLGRLALDRAIDHLDTLAERRVARRWTRAELEQLVHEPLPRQGLGFESTLERFFDRILPAATLVNHPRFFAYVPGPGSFHGALGEWLAAATNLFVGTWLGSASMTQLELLVLDWLRQAMALPPAFTGIVTSGGSMANLGGLAAARTRVGDPARATVYVGSEAHYSMAKAARVLGFADARVRTLPVDAAQRMRPEAVAAAIAADRDAGLEPAAVCVTAGTTSTGVIDPLADFAELCERERCWLHVDAAWGGAVALLPEFAAALAGLARADSITLDPHKWLYAPFECGCLLTRHVDALTAAFTADGQYMQDVPRDQVNFFERGPELTRGNRALKLWVLLRSVGVDAIAACIREDLRLCRLARELLAADARITIVTEPALSVFSFRVAGDDEANRRLVERILADGFLMLSSSRVGGTFVLRFCVGNHRTTERDIRASVARVLELVEE